MPHRHAVVDNFQLLDQLNLILPSFNFAIIHRWGAAAGKTKTLHVMRFSLWFSFGHIKVQLRAASYPLVVVFQRELTAAIIHDHYRIRLQTNACCADANMRFDSKVELEPQCTPEASVYLCFHGAYSFMKFNTHLALTRHETRTSHDSWHFAAVENKYLINYTRVAVFYKRCTASVTCSGYSSFSTDRSDNSRGVGISMRSNWDAFCQGAGQFSECVRSWRWVSCVILSARIKEANTLWLQIESLEKIVRTKTTVCWRGNDNFTWKGYNTQMRICMKGKIALMRAAFSFASARRPGHEVHKEQGQNKNCPFSMGVLEICPRWGAALALVASSYASMMFWNVRSCHCFMKNGRNCATQPFSCKKHTNSVQFFAVNSRRRRILGKKGGK